MGLRHPKDDLQCRTPVWVAMAELYLDTELTDSTISYIARTCASSPYSERELERIMFAEVWPAFCPNLLNVAGEWTGWDEDFVQQKVLQCYKKRFYISWRLNPIKRLLCREWADVVKECTVIRESRP
jgi:hypothetical protein